MKYIPNARIYDEQITLKNMEFCTRERSLPYVKMVHGRLLITLLDSSIECTDLNCVFLIVEATIHLLKNILTKMFNGKAKQNILDFYGNNFYYSKYYEKNQTTNESQMELNAETKTNDDEVEIYKKDLRVINESNRVTNQPFNLFELKELLQVFYSILNSIYLIDYCAPNPLSLS